MGGIFISYRRDDTKGFAGALLRELNLRFGEDQIFMDIDDIEPGLDFVDVLDQSLDSCDVLVPLIGKKWLSITDSEGNRRLDNPGDFVRQEIARALERDIRVVPLLVEGAPMPSPDELPADLAELSRRNAMSVSNSHWDFDVDKLSEVLRNAIGAPPPVAVKASGGGMDVVSIVSWIFAAIGVVLLLIGALAAFSDLLAGLIPGCIGGVFLLIGGVIITRRRAKKRREKALTEKGKAINATFQKVEIRQNIEINGVNPYRIVCRWQNPATRETLLFYSPNILFDPSEYVTSKTIRVMVDPNDYNNYLVDLSFLPKSAG